MKSIKEAKGRSLKVYAVDGPSGVKLSFSEGLDEDSQRGLIAIMIMRRLFHAKMLVKGVILIGMIWLKRYNVRWSVKGMFHNLFIMFHTHFKFFHQQGNSQTFTHNSYTTFIRYTQNLICSIRIFKDLAIHICRVALGGDTHHQTNISCQDFLLFLPLRLSVF